MADEPEVKSGEETAEQPSNAKQTSTEVEPKPDAEKPDQPEAESKDTTEDEVKSERGRKRVQDLANKAKSAEERADHAEAKVETLRSQIPEITKDTGEPEPDRQKTAKLPPWMGKTALPKPSEDLGEEVSPEQYRRHVVETADNLVSIRLAEKERHDTIRNNFDQDMNTLESKYPDAFDSEDKALQTGFKKVYENYRKAVKADPTVRFKEFAEPILEARSVGMEEGRDSASATLAEQKSQTAVTPSTTSVKKISSEQQLAEMLSKGEITAEEAARKYPDLLPSSD
jgi:polyhydroxyalkanoate synthesis regulator phasin